MKIDAATRAQDEAERLVRFVLMESLSDDQVRVVAKKVLAALPQPDIETRAECNDCGRQYGDEHGFPDLIIPNHLWRRISPSGDEGGLLCPSCICKRLHDAKITGVEGAFMSGSIESVSRPTMQALRMAENLQERLDRLPSVEEELAAAKALVIYWEKRFQQFHTANAIHTDAAAVQDEATPPVKHDEAPSE